MACFSRRLYQAVNFPAKVDWLTFWNTTPTNWQSFQPALILTTTSGRWTSTRF